MIVHTHHSFVDKPPPPTKSKRASKPKPPKVKTRKPRDIEAEHARKCVYYQKHKDEIKIRPLKKEVAS